MKISQKDAKYKCEIFNLHLDRIKQKMVTISLLQDWQRRESSLTFFYCQSEKKVNELKTSPCIIQKSPSNALVGPK